MGAESSGVRPPASTYRPAWLMNAPDETWPALQATSTTLPIWLPLSM